MIFIRIRVKGYLKNITENEIFDFDEKSIKNNNKITFSCDGVKTSIKINEDNVVLIREGNDFINTFVFDKNNSCCNYFLKENNYDVDIEIKTINIEIMDNSICIKYLVIDSNCEYEYKLEMSDV